MWLVTKLVWCFVVATEYSAVYCSIRFDEVEFYDPNKVLDESTSNGFVCAHLGEECQITPQCCGVATCALPSWSETPVCLVPGYKHDESFKKRFFSLHNLRPEDIRYIRDSYNTSQYDFLLSDLTFSAPPFENDAGSSSETLVANVSNFQDKSLAFTELGRNISEDSTFGINVTENNQLMNCSTIEYDEKNNKMSHANTNLDLNESNSRQSILDKNEPNNRVFSIMNSSNSSINGDFFKNHFMFLLMNKTLEMGDPKFDYKQFQDQIANTHLFKSIVKQLCEKMREINEMENMNLLTTTENSTFVISSSRESVIETTQRNNISRKFSRWNVVKSFFLSRKENNENYNGGNKNLEIVKEITLKETTTIKSQEKSDRKSMLESKYSETSNENDGFKKIIEDVDKIEEIIDNDGTIKTFNANKDGNDVGLFDFYNINIPLTSLEHNNGVKHTSRKINTTLESVFQDIGDTINTMMIDNKFDLGQTDSEVKKGSEDNSLPQYTNDSNVKANEIDGKTTKRFNFWDRIWKVPHNISREMESSFKKIFFSKKKSNKTVKQIKIPLNEYFILNLNTKRPQETTNTIPTQQPEKASEYSNSLYSSESEASSAEELYNNSYVFMVNKKNVVEPEKHSSWNKLMTFFHKEKVFPFSFDVNDQDVPTSDSGLNPSQIESESDPRFVETPKVIRLPEYLMPQALDERQQNETDSWIYEDSEDLEARSTEDRKTSNSSFFFFFK